MVRPNHLNTSMNFLSTPLTIRQIGSKLQIIPELEERISMLDKLVELIVYTPRGSFSADPDFGFEYWNHEFSNVSDTLFNNDSTGKDDYHKEGAKSRCEESVRQSLATYAPELKNVEVNMKLAIPDNNFHEGGKVFSRHLVTIEVSGKLDDGLGTHVNYSFPVEFFMEPTAKRRRYYP